MKKLFVIICVSVFSIGFAQEKETSFDSELAKSLNADDYGMKNYVFCLLKSGKNKTITQEESKKLFEGHMANINKLAAEGKLSVAGPFMKNERDYRGIYIFNVSTLEEAKKLTESDPAIAAGLLEAELTLWYGSAALQETLKIHNKIALKKI